MSKTNDADTEAAVRRLMSLAETSGTPLVATGRMQDHEREVFGLVVAMSGRRKDVEEVLDLMREKYPNSGVPTLDRKVDPRRGKRGKA